MVITELIKKIGERARERKEKIKLLDEEIRLKKLVEDRMKSADERELERFMEEQRQEKIKEMLKVMRKKRMEDIAFNHNPLNVPNIVNKVEWEVLKERNLFKNQKSMFSNQPFILKNNKRLLRSRRLFKI